MKLGNSNRSNEVRFWIFSFRPLSPTVEEMRRWFFASFLSTQKWRRNYTIGACLISYFLPIRGQKTHYYLYHPTSTVSTKKTRNSFSHPTSTIDTNESKKFMYWLVIIVLLGWDNYWLDMLFLFSLNEKDAMNASLQCSGPFLIYYLKNLWSEAHLGDPWETKPCRDDDSSRLSITMRWWTCFARKRSTRILHG